MILLKGLFLVLVVAGAIVVPTGLFIAACHILAKFNRLNLRAKRQSDYGIDLGESEPKGR